MEDGRWSLYANKNKNKKNPLVMNSTKQEQDYDQNPNKPQTTDRTVPDSFN